MKTEESLLKPASKVKEKQTVTIQLPVDLYAKVVAAAKEDDRSVPSFLARYIKKNYA